MNKTSIAAHLTLVGNDFDTDYVSLFLGTKPSYTRKKGELIRGGTQTFKHTEWGICVEEAESIDCDTQLKPIFDFIELHNEKLIFIKNELAAEWHLLIYISIKDGYTPGIVLTPDQIAFAHSISAHVGFDLYVL